MAWENSTLSWAITFNKGDPWAGGCPDSWVVQCLPPAIMSWHGKTTLLVGPSPSIKVTPEQGAAPLAEWSNVHLLPSWHGMAWENSTLSWAITFNKGDPRAGGCPASWVVQCPPPAIMAWHGKTALLVGPTPSIKVTPEQGAAPLAEWSNVYLLPSWHGMGKQHS